MRITRRQALVAAGAASAAGVGWWGRFGLGDEFEEHVAAQLGVGRELAVDLLRRARDSLGADYEARAAAFLLATTVPSRLVMPRAAREEAIGSLVRPMFDVAPYPGSSLELAGLRTNNAVAACQVLVRT